MGNDSLILCSFENQCCSISILQHGRIGYVVHSVIIFQFPSDFSYYNVSIIMSNMCNYASYYICICIAEVKYTCRFKSVEYIWSSHVGFSTVIFYNIHISLQVWFAYYNLETFNKQVYDAEFYLNLNLLLSSI